MLRVNIVGIGPGNPELLTNQARQAIEESNILIGDKRMLAAFDTDKRLFDTIKTSEIVEICQKADAEKDVVAVLVSGDVGFSVWPRPLPVNLLIVNATGIAVSAVWFILRSNWLCPGTMLKLSVCMAGTRILLPL